MRDERYQFLRSLIKTGEIKRLDQFFPIVPKTIMARDAKIHPERFNNLINDVGRFSIAEMHALAELIDVEYDTLNNLLNQQYQKDREIKEKNKSAFKSGDKGNRSDAL
jgi:hypothetical protein